MSSSRPTYTLLKIHQIYDRIGLPAKYRHDPGDEVKRIARGDRGLELLGALQRHTLAAIPFENLELHYSKHQIVDIAPDALFRKIITQGTGRGGYCMENNCFFATFLRTLGFEIMSTGGRVKSGDTSDNERPFHPFGHMVNIVTIQGARYLVDVGFGSGAPTHPLPLTDGKISMNIPPNESVRLKWDTIPDYEDKNSKLWIYQRRIGDDNQWEDMYCFPDNLEFLPSDFSMMNLWTSTQKTVFFTHKVMCVKFILSDDQSEIIGNVVLFENNVKRHIRGQKEDLMSCKSEDDRIKALREHFEIALSDEQKDGIKGMTTELKSRP